MRETIQYTPAWLLPPDPQPADGAAGAARGKSKPAALVPSFTLRFGTVVERSEMDADLEAEHNARQVPAYLMLEAAISGLRALLPPADAEQLEGLLRAAHAADGAELPAEDTARLSEVEDILARHWPEYRQLVQQNARFDRVAPVVAFQRYCTGWQNVTGIDGKPLEYARTPYGEIPEDVLRRLSPLVMRAVGFRAFNLQYGTGEAKN